MAAAAAGMPGMIDGAVSECEATYRARNPRSAAMWATASEVMPGGNTRASLWFEPFPLYMVRGEGAHLYDADGHDYLDFLGEFTSGIAGHSPPALKHAISEALERGINLSAHNEIEAELARELCARFQSMERVRFTNSGTEANIMAIMAARFHTGRETILVFEGGYHGGGLTFGASPDRRNLPFQFVVCPYNDLASARALAERHRDDLACILVEPMLGAAGCIPGDAGFLLGLRQIADEMGAILILDEVQTARLAPGGRQSQIGLHPDLTTIGKFFGGGLSFGAFGGAADVMAMFDPRLARGLPHSGTFNNNTLTLSAGLAAVREVLTPAAFSQLNARGERLRGALARLFEESEAPYTVTGLGSLMNIHPTASGRTADALRSILHFDLLESEIYLAARGLIALSFPLSDDDIANFLHRLQDALARRRDIYKSLSEPASDLDADGHLR